MLFLEPSFANGSTNLTDDFLRGEEAIEEALLPPEASPYENAINSLRKLPNIYCPYHKIKQLRETFSFIHKSVAKFWKHKPKKRITFVNCPQGDNA